MSVFKDLKFECRKCGSHELGHQKYVKCVTPVSVREDGPMEYGPSEIDEDDYLAPLSGFACKSCGRLIEHCGIRLETEKQLIDYLTMEPFDRQHQQQEYAEILDAQMYAQELMEKQQAYMAAIDESE